MPRNQRPEAELDLIEALTLTEQDNDAFQAAWSDSCCDWEDGE
jgi:hypothetical protein